MSKYHYHTVQKSKNYTTVTYWKGKKRPTAPKKKVHTPAYKDIRFWVLISECLASVFLFVFLIVQVQIAIANVKSIFIAYAYTQPMMSPIPEIASLYPTPKPLSSFLPLFKPQVLKLVSPLPRKLVLPTPTPSPTPIATPTIMPTFIPTPIPVREGYIYGKKTGNYYEDYIFEHESGYILNRVNRIGCIGLGQDCNHRLASACPNWKTDLACQLRFWEQYMLDRYGSWVKAYEFWIRTDCRPYCNHWW